MTHKHTHTHQIRETFKKVDVDGNKNLDNEEFGTAFALKGLKLAPNDRDELFKEFDVDGSGTWQQRRRSGGFASVHVRR